MTTKCLSVSSLERRFSNGNVETLQFTRGVNLLVGPPNTGKTKWLQTLDFLFGDTGENPFEAADETGLAEKYDAAAATIMIDDEVFRIERRWREAGSKGKVFVGEDSFNSKEFQHWLLGALNIPLLHFPKGNPMSGMTWPELSFRMLLRHIYRQQRFWGGIADQQPDGEQYACVAQFLGLAERIFTKEYGELIRLKMEALKWQARHDQYGEILQEIAGDVLDDEDVVVGLSRASLKASQDRVDGEIKLLAEARGSFLEQASERLPAHAGGYVRRLTGERAETVVELDGIRKRQAELLERRSELQRYRRELDEELARITRVEDAGEVLADLRVTHCPVCDQTVSQARGRIHTCFLCMQTTPEEPFIEQLGATRIQFERDRLSGELKEAQELLTVLEADLVSLVRAERDLSEKLNKVEADLAPAKASFSGLAQEELSSIDRSLGRASERRMQLGRIETSLVVGEEMIKKVAELEKEMEPLQVAVDRVIGATDFEAAATWLEDGMNLYLSQLNQLRPGTWRHSKVNIDVSRSSITFRVGSRRWNAVLGGTDTLYFLMAYHFGLMTVTEADGSHYPGLAVIDVPGEFSGEAIEDKENFIVQPFIDLLSGDKFRNAQVIITGASFSGLSGANFLRLSKVHVAS